MLVLLQEAKEYNLQLFDSYVSSRGGQGSIKITKNVRAQENGTWKSGQQGEGSLKVSGAHSPVLFRTHRFSP